MQYTTTTAVNPHPATERPAYEDAPGAWMLGLIILAGIVASIIFHKPKGPKA